MWDTAEDVIDLNRVGGEAEFTYRNEAALAFVNEGMEVYFHFRFRAWLFYCGCPGSLVGGLPGVSEFNLARIALELTMPTIFARTAPLKKKISMGMD